MRHMKLIDIYYFLLISYMFQIITLIKIISYLKYHHFSNKINERIENLAYACQIVNYHAIYLVLLTATVMYFKKKIFLSAP